MGRGKALSGKGSDSPQQPSEIKSYRSKVQTHTNSWQLEECLNPVRGIRDWQQRNGIKPHNHHKDNITTIKALSVANRLRKQKEEEEEAAAPPPFTPNLSSKKVSTPTPRRTSSSGGRDYVFENALATAAASVTARSRRRTGEENNGGKWLHKETYGQVPEYLRMRKMQLADQHAKAQAQKLADLIPPGMRVMPEDERLEMLDMLAKSRASVESNIQALPFVIETIRQKQKAAALQKRLEEIEEAIALFSRPTVFVEI